MMLMLVENFHLIRKKNSTPIRHFSQVISLGIAGPTTSDKPVKKNKRKAKTISSIQENSEKMLAHLSVYCYFWLCDEICLHREKQRERERAREGERQTQLISEISSQLTTMQQPSNVGLKNKRVWDFIFKFYYCFSYLFFFSSIYSIINKLIIIIILNDS